MKRLFLIVLDSFGIGELPDAAEYGDAGSNTLAAIAASPEFDTPNLKKLGFFNIDGVTCGEKEPAPTGSYAPDGRKKQGQGHHHRPLGDRRDGLAPAAAHLPRRLPLGGHRRVSSGALAEGPSATSLTPAPN